MKRKLLYTLLGLCTICLSCSEDEISYVQEEAIGQELVYDLSEYENTPFGLYKGIFTTKDSAERGALAIEIINDNLAKASLTLTSGEIVLYTGIPSRTFDGGLIVQFIGSSSSFQFGVHEDGSTSYVNLAVLNDITSLVKIQKENTRGALITNPGVWVGSTPAGNVISGTWNIMYDSQSDADGDASGFVNQIIFNSSDVGSNMGNGQSNCTDDGTTQTCDINGSTDAASGYSITWTGSHISSLNSTCSQFNGIWTGPAGASGAFTSDLQCVVPENDLCAGATELSCGESSMVAIENVTNTDTPASCGATTNFGIWYTYLGTANNDEITISTVGSEILNTNLNVYTGTCGALTCFDSDNNSGGGLQAELTFLEEEGVLYYIYAGAGTTVGNILVSLSCNAPPPLTPVLCGDDLVDSGGSAGNYSNDELTLNRITASSGETITLNFSQFNLENTWDHIRFFDGPSIYSPEILTSVEGATAVFTSEERQGFTGSSLLGNSIVSTGNELTIIFTSDEVFTFDGYLASVTCAPGFTDTGNQTVMTYAQRNARPKLTKERLQELEQEARDKYSN